MIGPDPNGPAPSRQGNKRRYKEAPEIGAACRRMAEALVRRAGEGELEALEALADLQETLNVQLARAVLAYRAGPAEATWTDIGVILNVTRQAAFKRFANHQDVDSLGGLRELTDREYGETNVGGER